MRFVFALVFAALSLFADGPAKPALGQIHSVYLLPMAGGLDQYLANRLTSTGIFVVVTDPKKADALFTDQLGNGFEQKFEELYPEAKPEDKEKDKEKDKDDSINAGLDKPAQRFGSMSRGRGTLFLVDRASRTVVWSTYHPVRNSQPAETNRRADAIVKSLAKALK